MCSSHLSRVSRRGKPHRSGQCWLPGTHSTGAFLAKGQQRPTGWGGGELLLASPFRGTLPQDNCSSLSLRDTGNSCQPDRPVPSPGSAQCNGLLKPFITTGSRTFRTRLFIMQRLTVCVAKWVLITGACSHPRDFKHKPPVLGTPGSGTLAPLTGKQ